MLVWKTVVPFWGNTHGKYRILSQEHRCFRSKEREKAGLTVPPPWSAVCSEQTNCGSCSPHGWASCLLGMLGAFLSGALSAEAGLYLRSLCQGEYSDRAKLVKKLLLNLTLCGLTQCTTMLCWKANCKLWSKMWQKHFFFFFIFFKRVTDRFRGKTQHKTLPYSQSVRSRAQSHRCHNHVVANRIEFTQLTRQKASLKPTKLRGGKHAVS